MIKLGLLLVAMLAKASKKQQGNNKEKKASPKKRQRKLLKTNSCFSRFNFLSILSYKKDFIVSSKLRSFYYQIGKIK